MPLFGRRKQQPAPEIPAVPQLYCVNIAPLLAAITTQRIREQRARDFARYGIYYGKPLEELLGQNMIMGERENESI
jgi:hypothetical protein